VEIELPSKDTVSPTVDTLADAFDSVSVLSVTDGKAGSQTAGKDDSGLETLTEKQTQALQAAFYHGYFDQPRGNTATAIAESLDVSHSTFLQHLHRAQHKVFNWYFG
jgi:predicted DNA binding protein